ncbi:hypothetical protein QTV49_004288 [Vibrio vulnificus]|nr:hypothetical protein [Vibrio vulnificus]
MPPINLTGYATKFSVPIDEEATIELTKKTLSNGFRYVYEDTEYSTQNFSTIPEGAIVISVDIDREGMWSATVSSKPLGFKVFALEDNMYLNWSHRLDTMFGEVLIEHSYFDTPEQAYENASSVYSILKTLDKDEINKQSGLYLNSLRKSLCNDRQFYLPNPPEDQGHHREIDSDTQEVETFFFVAFPYGDKSRVTVIDLSHACGYERGDWASISEHNFNTAPAAIKYARQFAKLNDLVYEEFDSRYCSEYSEK